MSKSLTLEFDSLPAESAECAACLTRLTERLRALAGIESVELFRDRRRVVIDVVDARDRAEVETQARQIMEQISDGYVHEELRIGGMDCPSCASEISDVVAKLNGVVSASVDFPTARLVVEYSAAGLTSDQVRGEVRKLGFSATPVREASEEVAPSVLPLLLGAVLWLMGCFAPSDPVWIKGAAFSACALVAGWRMFLPGLLGIARLRFGTNTLMSIAVIGALAIGEWGEAAAVAWLFALGNYLQTRTLGRTRSAIRSLIDAAPKMATVITGGASTQMEVANVPVGSRVEVAPFGAIPLDGIVIEGEALLDTSSLTGESDPVWVSPGSTVLAGSITDGHRLLILTEKPFADSNFARMVSIIEEGQSARAPQQEMIDRVTAWYTPAVLIAAILLGVGLPLLGVRAWQAGLHQAFWLLMVACPCALVISIPVATVTAIGAASRLGVMVKGGVFLESLSNVRHWVFDKTGTLTHSRMRVTSFTEHEVGAGQLAAALAAASRHPASVAILRAFPGALAAASDIEELKGQGVSGKVNGRTLRLGSPAFVGGGTGSVILAEDGRVLAEFVLSEDARGGIDAVFQSIRSAGASPVLLSGDSADRVEYFAASSGVSDFRSASTPESKALLVRKLSGEGVVMVGDGVNDTAALQEATVGIAMGAMGSDSAIDSADIVLLNDDIRKIPTLIRLSRDYRAILAQNIWFSLGTKAVLIAAGVLTPLPFWLAVAGDMGVSLIVIANALRLRTARGST
ncbi:MAG: cadmium-translocating P-type ATPase [Armatimonadota bacterium]|nr:cadmium-translocating P-type ATPase [Armatimonadota bacterium]